jgi:UDP-glucose:(heptosyl)LPS alpha-1,3-glucosyltransferase
VGARIDGPVDARVVCHRIPTMARPHWLDLWQFARRAERLVPGLDCDVVHNQIRPFVPGVLTVGGGCHRFYLSEVLPRERGAVRAWAKRQAPLHRLLLALERRGLTPARCPVVLTNSALARAGILKYYDYPGDRIVVAHNGVDAERFRPAASPESREAVRRRLSVGPGEILVLFVGSGFARKGLGALLEAVARIEAAGSAYRVAVVGGGSSGAWRRRAERLGVADRVRFVGAVPDPETYYRAADIFALPTHFDPFANATLEAMASALPVVTTRENGVAELIRPGRDGLVIEHPEAVDDLARALGALRDPDARRAMGAEARRTALRHPWDAPLEAALRAYQRAAAERAASPAESQ